MWTRVSIQIKPTRSKVVVFLTANKKHFLYFAVSEHLTLI